MVCDGDEIGSALAYQDTSFVNPYKCPFNEDEHESICVDRCPQDAFACPYAIGRNSLKKLCKENNEICLIPENVANLSNLTTNGYLWRCNENFSQWIKASQKCDGQFDCYLGEDESQSVCDKLELYLLMLITIGTVAALLLLLLLFRECGLKKHPITCRKCMGTDCFRDIMNW